MRSRTKRRLCPARFDQSSLFRVEWHRGQLSLSSSQLLQKYVDGLVELVIDACVLTSRIVIDIHVRLDAVSLDGPLLALDFVVADLRDGQAAAIHERREAVEANEAAPAPLADEFAQLVVPKRVRERLRIRGGALVQQADFLTRKDVLRIR